MTDRSDDAKRPDGALIIQSSTQLTTERRAAPTSRLLLRNVHDGRKVRGAFRDQWCRAHRNGSTLVRPHVDASHHTPTHARLFGASSTWPPRLSSLVAASMGGPVAPRAVQRPFDRRGPTSPNHCTVAGLA